MAFHPRAGLTTRRIDGGGRRGFGPDLDRHPIPADLKHPQRSLVEDNQTGQGITDLPRSGSHVHLPSSPTFRQAPQVDKNPLVDGGCLTLSGGIREGGAAR